MNELRRQAHPGPDSSACRTKPIETEAELERIRNQLIAGQGLRKGLGLLPGQADRAVWRRLGSAGNSHGRVCRAPQSRSPPNRSRPSPGNSWYPDNLTVAFLEPQPLDGKGPKDHHHGSSQWCRSLIASLLWLPACCSWWAVSTCRPRPRSKPGRPPRASPCSLWRPLICPCWMCASPSRPEAPGIRGSQVLPP